MPDNTVVDQQYVPDGTNTRKIFLDTHKRFYLVASGIHCDGPGFPKVAREKVCKAGFVIRRRTVTPPSSGMKEVEPILRNLAAGRAKLARVNQVSAIEEAAFSASAESGNAEASNGKLQSPRLESLVKTRASLQALLALEKTRFEDWVARFGVVPELQGWLASPQGPDQVGSWQPVEETPADLGLESSFPLYPLIPDKNEPAHAGQYDTVYFGVLPTSSHDHEGSGRARFDDREFYEVRCWALRHLRPHESGSTVPVPGWNLLERTDPSLQTCFALRPDGHQQSAGDDPASGFERFGGAGQAASRRGVRQTPGLADDLGRQGRQAAVAGTIGRL